MDYPIIELKETTFAAQDKEIVKSVSWAFEEGKTTALVGPSGGGKSTVLKLAAGLIVPTDGDVRYYGHSIATMNRQRNLMFRRNSAFVFQDSALWANQTLRQILELPLKIHNPKMTREEMNMVIMMALAQTGYRREIDVRPSQLSMGEQKLIAFARAMLCGPRLLFLDEWTESLDDASSRRLVDLVKNYKADGNTVIFVSHNFRVIKELADTICMIVDGKISFSVTSAELEADDSLIDMIEKGMTS
jgi:phospholipid/cholesterol/gamma-HCH transport system ATP-binding protein